MIRHVLVVVVIIVVVRPPGAEHRPHRVGHLADRRAGDQQQTEQRADEQQRRGDPLGQTLRKGAADGESDEPRGVLASRRVVRRAGPQVPQAEHGQRDHRRAEDQPRPGVGVGLGAHQQDRDRGERDRQQQRRPSRSARAGSCRSIRRPAVRRRTTSSRRRRPRFPAAPARCRPGGGRGRCRGRGPPIGPSIRRPLASMNQPARAPRPMASPAAGTGDALRRLTGLRRGAGRAARDPDFEPAFDLLERAPERAAVLLGMASSLVADAPNSPSATRVTVRCRNLVSFAE